jgi:hypothetical protein
MRPVKRISIGIGVLLGGWIWSALAGNLVAEDNPEGIPANGWVAKGDWQRRVLQGRPTTHSGPEQAKADQQRAVQQGAPLRQNRLRTASRAGQPGPEEIPPGEKQVEPAPSPTDQGDDSTGMEGPEMYLPGPGGDSVAGGQCYGDSGEAWEDGGGPYGGGEVGLLRFRSAWWARDLSLLAGAHGFKGPLDQGRNGNFGLHEGANFGAPLGGPWGGGYQVGFAAVHSNFSGDRTTDPPRRGDRDQFFFTTGIFRRAVCGGIQWGVAFDLLRDVYYADVDLKQIRTEIGYVSPNGRGEIGYWGAYGVANDEIVLHGSNASVEPTDLFAFYYCRRFESGGEGRLWGGFTGKGDGLLGADFRVPLGRSWALENRFNYLIPKQRPGATAQEQESWSLSIGLVWYLGQPAYRAQSSPYAPLLDVADNSVFMCDVVNR